MADLVIKTRCKSWLRDGTDKFLDLTFPVWAIASPIALFCIVFALVMSITQVNPPKTSEAITFIGMIVCYMLGSLMLKRALSNDYLAMNKQGITLPYMSGGQVRLKSHIPWNKVQTVDALLADAPEKALLTVSLTKGGTRRIPVSQLEPDFVEQFVLAARMWAPDRCAPGLDALQNNLRLGARATEQQSYTDLWEDELSRRFCPTAYIPLEPGRVLRNGSLKIIRQLATGGLAALYLCQMNDSKIVVLKEATTPAHGSDSLKEKANELFQREAQLLMKIDYPGIVHVLDCFTEFERNYMILEYVTGMDLWQLVRQNGPQKESDVLEWAVQLANTLKYLHEREQPIIHRDMTPDNIILRNDGKVVLVDFGAANEFIGTATGTFVGKHSFIAPEQLRGKATTQSDIYAFGCTLYFLLVGHEPDALATSNPKEATDKDGAPLQLQVSDELCQLIESCTQLEAAERYQSVAQLIPVLKRLAAQVSV